MVDLYLTIDSFDLNDVTLADEYTNSTELNS